MYYSIQDFIENGIANLEECEKSLMKNPLNWTDQIPFSVVVLGNFRRFLLVIFLFLFLHLDFSFIYNKFSMPFWDFFY